jgi:hypothetical protein
MVASTVRDDHQGRSSASTNSRRLYVLNIYATAITIAHGHIRAAFNSRWMPSLYTYRPSWTRDIEVYWWLVEWLLSLLPVTRNEVYNTLRRPYEWCLRMKRSIVTQVERWPAGCTAHWVVTQLTSASGYVEQYSRQLVSWNASLEKRVREQQQWNIYIAPQIYRCRGARKSQSLECRCCLVKEPRCISSIVAAILDSRLPFQSDDVLIASWGDVERCHVTIRSLKPSPVES